MKNVFFLDEDITANDLYFVCYMVECVARKLKQPNEYVVNTMGKHALQEKLSLANVLHCENPLSVIADWIVAYDLQSSTYDVTEIDIRFTDKIQQPP